MTEEYQRTPEADAIIKLGARLSKPNTLPENPRPNTAPEMPQKPLLEGLQIVDQTNDKKGGFKSFKAPRNG